MSCKNLFGAKAKNLPLILHAAVLVMTQASVCSPFHKAMVSRSVWWGWGVGQVVMPRIGESSISNSYP